MFDTLKYSKTLEAAGVSREQAEAHISIFAEIVEGHVGDKRRFPRAAQRLGATTAALLAAAVAFLKLVN